MADDNEVALTAQEMNLPLDYVQAVYEADETKEIAAPDGGEESPSPQAAEPAAPVETPSDDGYSGGIPEKLANRAKVYGLDPDKFRDADSLQDQIDAYDRQLLAETQRQQQAQQQQPQQQVTQQSARRAMFDQQRANQQQAENPQQQAAPDPLSPPEFQFDLGDEYDPEEVAKFNSGLQKVADYISPVVAHIQQLTQVVQQQNDYIQQVAQREQAVQVEETNKAFDAAVDEIGSELFGSGRYEELDPAAQTQRMKLMESASALADTYSQRGIPIPDVPDLVQQAFRLTFADEAKKSNQAELRQRVVDRSKRRLGTGSNHKASHRTASGKIKPYQGKDPSKDPVLLGAYADLQKEGDFR